MAAGHASKCDPEAPEVGLQREGKAPTPPRPLTQLADEVDGAVVAAVRRVQVHQELGVQPGHFSLQHIGDALALVLLQSALPGTHHRGPGEDTGVTTQMPHASGLLLTASPTWGTYMIGGPWMAIMAGTNVRYREWLKTGERMLARTASRSGWHRSCCLVGRTGGGGGVG